MTKPVPGSPDDVFAQTREIRRQAGLLRAHGRSVSTTVGNQVSGWSGTASVAYASRSGQHSRAATSGATTLESACSSAERFGRDLRRIQGLANGHLKTRDRLVRELELALRDRRHPQLLAPDERRSLDDDIADLRRRIRNEDNAIDRQVNDYKGIKARLYGEIAKMLPPETREAWYKTADYQSVIHYVKAGGATYANINYFRSLPPVARSATIPDLVRNAYVAADKLQAVRGGMLYTAQKVPGARRVFVGALGRTVVKYTGPIGAVLTVYDASHDLADAGGYDGGRGTTTRVLAGGAIVGAPLLFVAPEVGAVLVTAYATWTLGNLVYDNRNNIDRAAHKWTGRAATGVPTLSDSALKSLSPKVGCDAPPAPKPSPGPAEPKPAPAQPRPATTNGTYNGRVHLPGPPQPYPGLERLYDANDRLTAALGAQQPSDAPPVAVPTHPLVRTQEVAS
ncbi:hypothetical protein [Luteipulveratus halotolerans]|uniref:Uncharacterized protein n=1 Tax=Luteipulveratus halotolerans TaxID=1631356 RepID=A0A0L6CIC6_9MICO|nr:hypothetical protein [Luteipulveratus halotolerans]KNX37547.1 hypothetical protein VV01_10930 [Luteipulveratus halotolerans]